MPCGLPSSTALGRAAGGEQQVAPSSSAALEALQARAPAPGLVTVGRYETMAAWRRFNLDDLWSRHMMSQLVLSPVVLATALALISLGGGLYEFSVVDPAWPRRPDIVQPGAGGVSRRRFWIPAHVAFELVLILALVATWARPEVRTWLLVALASHAAMRIWSAFDFIPKALAFEKADSATFDAEAANRWTRRSRLRLPLDLVTCGAMLAALMAATSAAP